MLYWTMAHYQPQPVPGIDPKPMPLIHIYGNEEVMPLVLIGYINGFLIKFYI